MSRRRMRTVAVALVVAWLGGGGAMAMRPEPVATDDAYGYTAIVQTGCSFDYVDISDSGIALSFTASGAAPAEDDGAAVVGLQRPFELYGVPVEALVVSANGYLAAATGLDAEDGGDFSNDVAVPAIPGNRPGVPARLMVYHDAGKKN